MLERFVRPQIFLILTVLASFALWLIPGSSEALRGFSTRSDLTVGGLAVLVLWYGLCAVVIAMGVAAGSRIRSFHALRRFEFEPDLERRFYWFITALAAIGVAAALIGVAQQVSIAEALAGRQVNKLVHALPGQTSFATLRYATAIAAPVGIYLWRRKQAPGNLALFNVALLVVNIALASRISLIVAILVYAMIYYRTSSNGRIKVWALVAGAAVIFMSLTAFTYVRSANYYEKNGISSPIAMNFYQIASYLGAPAQVSVGVSNLIADGSFSISGDPVSSLRAITPTFLVIDKTSIQTGSVSDRYDNRVSVANNLSTNSAFADTYAASGVWGLFYTLGVLAIAAFGFGVFARYRSVVVGLSAVLLYGFFEYWRIFMFNKGFLLFLLVAIGAAVVFALTLPRFIDLSRKVGRRVVKAGRG